MDQVLIVEVTRPDQLLKKAAEIRSRGLEIIGIIRRFAVMKVRGDPRKLEGMTGVKIRKEETMEGLE